MLANWNIVEEVTQNALQRDKVVGNRKLTEKKKRIRLI